VTLLAACGRKGPLELPPSAQVVEPGTDPAAAQSRPAMTREGYPIAPPGENRRIPLDWLID
jgi:predicted small lipoprotein YifL